MKPLRSLLILTIALAAALGAPANPLAEASRDLESRIEAVMDAFYSLPVEAPREEREAVVRDALGQALNYQGIVRRCFGRHWRTLNPVQQETLTELLIALVIRSYTDNFTGSDRPAFEFRPAVEIAPNRIEIGSTAVVAGRSYALTYRLLQIEGRWDVYDVIAEGVSLVSNYREQIDAHFRNRTAEDLIVQLRNQLNS